MAANEAGLRVLILVRDGNVPLSEEAIKNFKAMNSFDSIFENITLAEGNVHSFKAAAT